MSVTKKIIIKTLKGKKKIDFLFNKSTIVQTENLLLRLVKEPGTGVYFSGVSVPKKGFKRAVDRNLIKRLMRISVGKLDKKRLFNGMGMLIYKGEKKPLAAELNDNVLRLFEAIKKT